MTIVFSRSEVQAARAIAEKSAVSSSKGGNPTLVLPNGISVAISGNLENALMQIIAMAAREVGVEISPSKGKNPDDRMIGTGQAADILDVSRPYLVSLIEKGIIPHHKVGKRRRVRTGDIQAYKAHRDQLDREVREAFERTAEAARQFTGTPPGPGPVDPLPGESPGSFSHRQRVHDAITGSDRS